MEKDINIFASGWNRNNAYVFGWVMSDGCLRKEGRNKTSYVVSICSNDYEIVEWMHKYMCVGNKIYRQGEGNYMIKYRNSDGIRFMMQNRLTERKSLTKQFPDIPSEYLCDFVRGYFDGNGSIVVRETQYNAYAQVSFTSGSKEFLDELHVRLALAGISTRLYADGRSGKSAFYLRVIKRSGVDKLFGFMYSDLGNAGFLARKYDKYSWFEENYKPKYKSHNV